MMPLSKLLHFSAKSRQEMASTTTHGQMASWLERMPHRTAVVLGSLLSVGGLGLIYIGFNENTIKTISQRIDSLHGRMDNLVAIQVTMKDDIHETKSNVAVLKTDVAALKADVGSMKWTMASIDDKVDKVCLHI